MLQDPKFGLAHINLQLLQFLHTQATVAEEKTSKLSYQTEYSSC